MHSSLLRKEIGIGREEKCFSVQTRKHENLCTKRLHKKDHFSPLKLKKKKKKVNRRRKHYYS